MRYAFETLSHGLSGLLKALQLKDNWRAVMKPETCKRKVVSPRSYFLLSLWDFYKHLFQVWGSSSLQRFSTKHLRLSISLPGSSRPSESLDVSFQPDQQWTNIWRSRTKLWITTKKKLVNTWWSFMNNEKNFWNNKWSHHHLCWKPCQKDPINLACYKRSPGSW